VDLIPSKAREKIHVPDGPAKLAVRNSLQPGSFLQSHGFANGDIFDLPQFLCRDFAFLGARSSRLQLGWAKQTSYLVGSKGGRLGEFINAVEDRC